MIKSSYQYLTEIKKRGNDMIQYSIVMFLASVLLILFGIFIYRGRTDLIRGYYQINVKNKAAYGRAIGKSLFIISAFLILSGIVGLFAKENLLAFVSIGLLIIGLIVGIACLIVAYKNHTDNDML